MGWAGPTPVHTHLLEGEFLVVGLDTADVVRRGGVQGLHEQVQGGAELGRQKSRLVTYSPFTFCGCRINLKEWNAHRLVVVVVAIIVLIVTANPGQEEIQRPGVGFLPCWMTKVKFLLYPGLRGP